MAFIIGHRREERVFITALTLACVICIFLGGIWQVQGLKCNICEGRETICDNNWRDEEHLTECKAGEVCRITEYSFKGSSYVFAIKQECYAVAKDEKKCQKVPMPDWPYMIAEHCHCSSDGCNQDMNTCTTDGKQCLNSPRK